MAIPNAERPNAGDDFVIQSSVSAEYRVQLRIDQDAIEQGVCHKTRTWLPTSWAAKPMVGRPVLEFLPPARGDGLRARCKEGIAAQARVTDPYWKFV